MVLFSNLFFSTSLSISVFLGSAPEYKVNGSGFVSGTHKVVQSIHPLPGTVQKLTDLESKPNKDILLMVLEDR